jgi:2-methylcitrate dehydratase PrpD
MTAIGRPRRFRSSNANDCVVAHFSASVVAARLLNLPPEAIVAAQGIAASTASGLQVFLEEGAWTKRMHPGWAAVAGITAARLAQHGFKAPTRPYEGKFGFFDTHLQHPPAAIDLQAELATLGSVWELAETAVKPYPVCHFIHGCADAAIELHQRIDCADIVRAEAFLPRDKTTPQYLRAKRRSLSLSQRRRRRPRPCLDRSAAACATYLPTPARRDRPRVLKELKVPALRRLRC